MKSPLSDTQAESECISDMVINIQPFKLLGQKHHEPTLR